MPAGSQRVTGLLPAAAAAGLCFCALFFGGGASNDPLVWIGGLTLVLAAVLLGFVAAGLDRTAWAFIGCLAGLAVWCGVSIVWSISPDRSWGYTNRTLVYAGFAFLGLLVGSRVSRDRLAAGAAVLLGALAAWALLAKCVPGIYTDYGRVARLRSPLGYWNELALLCDAGVAVALWLAAARRRAEGVLLLYALAVTVLLTYSRFGVALACAAAAAFVLLDRNRVESLTAIALGGGLGAAVFGVAFALPGITDDEQPRSSRAHDGWIFALVVLAGAALAYLAARAALRHPVQQHHRARVERVAGIAAVVLAVAGLAVSVGFGGRIWNEFTNPASEQISQTKGRFTSASSSNRWTWWQEAWDAFTDNPGGGTGAGTFELTDRRLHTSTLTTVEPHNVPLQFLSETGIVGFLLYLGVAVAALAGAWRARREPAGAALGIAVAVFFAHAVFDFDWDFVATCGPLLFVAGALLARPAPERVRRPVLAVAAVALSLGIVYSLAAPWLADRALAEGTESGAKSAHSYDPLNVDALTTMATYEDAAGHPLRAQKLFRDAVSLEPENAEAWYALGEFYFSYKAWRLAYEALNNSYTYNQFGPASEECGLLDQARKNATGYVPPRVKVRCPRLGRSSSP